MSEKPEKPWPALYTWVWPMVVAEARRHGYAVGLHGSMARDLDVIAVPWTEDAAPAEELVAGLLLATGAEFREGASLVNGEWVKREPGEIAYKPHGRRAWVLHFGAGAYIDLSVMPRQEPAA